MKSVLMYMLMLGTLLGCQTLPNRPSWIESPQEGAVGSSTTHVKGRHYQEALAISRARERLAARYGVDVSSVQTINEQVRQGRGSVTSDKITTQVIRNNVVKTHVREIWHDKASDTLWVWVYPIE